MDNIVILILAIVHAVVCIALILVVMFQSNRGEGLTGALSGQFNSGANSKKNAKDELKKNLTIVLSIVFGAIVIAIDVIYALNIKL